MIASLTGLIRACQNEGLLIEVQGVGYYVHISRKLEQQLSTQVGKQFYILTQLMSREDSLDLYGFASTEEKELFGYLNRVSGIGPRTALGILSTFDCSELVAAILNQQAKLLSQAPGIGPKTAQRIILELKEVLAKREWSHEVPQTSSVTWISQDWREEIELTLSALGYSLHEIAQAFQACQTQLEKNDNIDEWIRLLLAHLSHKDLKH